MAVIKGKVMWAKVHKPDTKFEPTWEVIVMLSKEQAKSLKSEGLNVKVDDNGEFYVRLRRKALTKDGSPNTPPRVLDAEGNPFNKLIGNGSTCAVQYFVSEYNYKGKTGKKTTLMGVKILDLVPFERDELAEFDGSEGLDGSSEVEADVDFDDEDPFND